MDKPQITIITGPVAASPLITRARILAAEHGGNLRAPHYTVSIASLGSELALAAGGTLLLDEPGEFSRGVVDRIAWLWCAMTPAVRPLIILTIRADTANGKPDHDETAQSLARLADLYDGWTITNHTAEIPRKVRARCGGSR